MDRIVKGAHEGVKVVYEDEQCLAVESGENLALISKIYKRNASPAEVDSLVLLANKIAPMSDCRIESDDSTRANCANLCLHIVRNNSKPDGQEEQKESENSSKLMREQMGFSLVVEAIIKAKKPLVGHNAMYDWLYLFNQFVAPLPPTYAEFIAKWHECFPWTYDNKVLCFKSGQFSRTSLGEIYEKCQGDPRIKSNLNFVFDLVKGCDNYEGAKALSHYHEAAYDAHMTGLTFAHVVRLFEIDERKQADKSKAKDAKEKPKEKGKGSKDKGNSLSAETLAELQKLKRSPVDAREGPHNCYINQMMLDQWQQGRVYHFHPLAHQDYQTQIQTKAEFPETVYLEFEAGFLDALNAEAISDLFAEFGDFYVQKVDARSCFLEFFHLDSTVLPERTCEAFLAAVVGTPHFRVTKACMHQQAPRFQSHDRFDGDQ